jgi:hypothetical protein
MGCPSGNSNGTKYQFLQLSQRRLKKQFISFHEQDIVFGDLRVNNILHIALKDHAVLVDFYWPEKAGESRYPATLNPGTGGMTWEENVCPYGIMQKAHDLWQLGRLKDLYTKSN